MKNNDPSFDEALPLLQPLFAAMKGNESECRIDPSSRRFEESSITVFEYEFNEQTEELPLLMSTRFHRMD